MLKKSQESADVDDLLKAISNPKISDAFRAKYEAQLEELYEKKMRRRADESAGANSIAGANNTGGAQGNAYRFM